MTNTPVHSIYAGRITRRETETERNKGKSWGNLLVIEHTGIPNVGTVYSSYAHLSDFAINPETNPPRKWRKGDSVPKNAVIGYVGNTGNVIKSDPNSPTSGIHLHFQVDREYRDYHPNCVGSNCEPQHPFSVYPYGYDDNRVDDDGLVLNHTHHPILFVNSNLPPEVPSAPTCAISANPTLIIQSQSSTLSWTTANDPTSTSIDNGVGPVDPSGSIEVSPASKTTYTMTVSNSGGSNQCSTAIDVIPSPPPGPSCPANFIDNFNRANGPVENGWLNAMSNTDGDLIIRSGALSTPESMTGDGATIYRPIDMSVPLTVSATLTQMNGFGGLLKRYSHGFNYGTDASGTGGSAVGFARGDENYSDSRVIVNGIQYFSSFQFGASIFVKIIFSPDGSVSGYVTGDGKTFEFNSGPVGSFSGSNLAIGLGYPDSRTSIVTNPTVDNLSFVYQCERKFAIVDLGTLNGTFSQGLAINNSGQVAGSWVTNTGRGRAFFWDAQNPPQDIGFVGGDQSYATGVNDSGQITGSAARADGVWRYFVWDTVSGIQEIDVNIGVLNGLSGINDLGHVTGNLATSIVTQRAFSWDGVVHNLGTVPGGSNSFGVSINESGNVTGYAWAVTADFPELGFQNHAFFWDGALMRDLGTLGRLNSIGTSINDSGHITGYVYGLGSQAPFIWDRAVMRELGTTFGGGFGWGINNLDQVVGEAGGNCAGCAQAILWDGFQMQNLNDQLVDKGGWVLNSAKAINDLGQITGYGTIGGETHAFVLTPVSVP